MYILRKGCDYGRNSHVYLNPCLERGGEKKRVRKGSDASDDGIVFLFLFKLLLILMKVHVCVCDVAVVVIQNANEMTFTMKEAIKKRNKNTLLFAASDFRVTPFALLSKYFNNQLMIKHSTPKDSSGKKQCYCNAVQS